MNIPDDLSGRPDRQHDAFMTAKQQCKQIEDLLPRTIFVIDKPHTVDELLAADDLGVGIDPLAGHVATHIARGDLDHAAVAYALGLARVCSCIDIEPLSVGSWSIRGCDGKPDRGADTVAASAVGLE